MRNHRDFTITLAFFLKLIVVLKNIFSKFPMYPWELARRDLFSFAFSSNFLFPSPNPYRGKREVDSLWKNVSPLRQHAVFKDKNGKTERGNPFIMKRLTLLVFKVI